MNTTKSVPAFSYACGTISAKLSRGERVLLRDVSFSVPAGERLAVIGETGSGKTMLALSILGLLPANVQMRGGYIQMDGAELPTGRHLQTLRGDKLVYIPQNGAEFLLPTRTVRKQLYDSLKKLGLPRKEFLTLATEKLSLAGFDAPETVLDKYPFQLSGGMAQRVTIALAACSRARLLIADEPTNGLDEAGRAQFFALLDSIFPDAAKLIITHDISVAARCDRVLVLCGGRMLETGASSAILCAPSHPYTKALLAAQVANGMQPSPVLRDGVSDCPFYARCPEADKACLNGAMQKRTDGKTEWWCCHACDQKLLQSVRKPDGFAGRVHDHSGRKHRRYLWRKRHRKIDACKNSLRRDSGRCGGDFSRRSAARIRQKQL